MIRNRVLATDGRLKNPVSGIWFLGSDKYETACFHGKRPFYLKSRAVVSYGPGACPDFGKCWTLAD